MGKPVIGVLGSGQINHLIPVLRQKYEVVDIQEKMGNKSKPGKFLAYLQAIKGVDIIYNVFTVDSFRFKARLAKRRGIRVVSHWIGSDVRFAQEGSTNLDDLSNLIDQHVSCFDPLRKKLEPFGIEAPVVPIVPFNMEFELCEMPKKHAVLVYLPEGRETLYGFEEIRKAMAQFPELPFYIVANGNEELFAPYPNAVVLGMLGPEEMSELYHNVSTLVRMHTSDGLSMMVLEALGKGKHVIWDHEFDYVLPGKNASEIIDSLEKVLSQPLAPRQDAHDFMVNAFTEERFLDEVERYIVGDWRSEP